MQIYLSFLNHKSSEFDNEFKYLQNHLIMTTMTDRQKQLLNSLPPSWQKPLEDVCKKPEIDNLLKFLKEREKSGAIIYPAKQNIFAALKATPFDKVNVVIVGQDPYHGPGQAHGLSFSVPAGIAIPPSLRNIFKELHSDIAIAKPANGTLTSWAKQGVLLLNAILTVEEGKPASHANKGWEIFTDAIIEAVLKRKHPTVLLLWGAYAQKKVQNLHLHIDPAVAYSYGGHGPAIHLILKATHPSPLSITGFLGCRHFSKANAFLKQHNLPEINWADI